MLEIQSLKNQVILLRLQLDHAIASGKCFEEVRKIYSQIKETDRTIIAREAQLGVMSQKSL